LDSRDAGTTALFHHMGNALVVPLVKAMDKRISALAEDEQRS